MRRWSRAFLFCKAMTYYIYALLDPRGTKMAYVGRTKDLEGRYKQHIVDVAKRNKKSRWIYEMRIQNLFPLLYLLETTEQELSGKRELYWYRELARDFEMTNNQVPSLHVQMATSRIISNVPEPMPEPATAATHEVKVITPPIEPGYKALKILFITSFIANLLLLAALFLMAYEKFQSLKP